MKLRVINLSELGIDQAFAVGTFSRGPVFYSEHFILIPQQQYGLAFLNYHAPLPTRQCSQWHHRHPLLSSSAASRGWWFFSHWDFRGLACGESLPNGRRGKLVISECEEVVVVREGERGEGVITGECGG